MTHLPLAFVDCETTGLTITDEPWEIAIIRRMPGGTDQEHVIHVEHDGSKAEDLREDFRVDYVARFGIDYPVYTRTAAAGIVHALLCGVHIVGVNPAFDAAMLERLLAGKPSTRIPRPRPYPYLTPSWDYHLIDLYALSIGRRAALDLGLSSDELSAEFGVPTTTPTGDPLYARHTALGDARWARDWWDALTVTQPSSSSTPRLDAEQRMRNAELALRSAQLDYEDARIERDRANREASAKISDLAADL